MDARDRAFLADREAKLNSKTQAQRLKEAKRLPFLADRRRQRRGPPEVWTVSYSEVMPQFWAITITVDHMGQPNDQTIVTGAFSSHSGANPPDARYMIAALCSAMTEPEMPWSTGPPHRPIAMLVAYRLHYAYNEIEAAMSEIGIYCRLESKQEAIESARTAGTHYLGLNAEDQKEKQKSDVNDDLSNEMSGLKLPPAGNFSDSGKCDVCVDKTGTSVCSACKCRKYCSRECQRVDWKGGHKGQCGNLQNLKSLQQVDEDRSSAMEWEWHIGFTSDDKTSHCALWVMTKYEPVGSESNRFVPLASLPLRGTTPTREEVFACISQAMTEPAFRTPLNGPCRPFSVCLCDCLDKELARNTAALLTRLGVKIEGTEADSQWIDQWYRVQNGLELTDDLFLKMIEPSRQRPITLDAEAKKKSGEKKRGKN